METASQSNVHPSMPVRAMSPGPSPKPASSTRKRLAVIAGVILVITVAAVGIWYYTQRLPSEADVVAAQELISFGREKEDDLRFAEAVTAYTQAQKRDPGNADSYTGIAAIYILKGRPNDARNVLLSGIEQARQASPVYLALGELYLEEGEVDQALVYFKKAVSSDRSNHEAQYRLAEGYVEAGAFDDARDELDIPEDAGEWHVRAILLDAILEEEIDGAASILDSLDDELLGEDENTEIADTVSMYRNLLDRVLELEEDERSDIYVDTIRSFGALTAGFEDVVIDRLEPYAEDAQEYWDLHLYLGTAYMQNGDTENAASHLTLAVSLNPGDYSGPWLLARVYGEMGEDNKMIEQYERAVALAPEEDRVTVRREYVDVLMENGQYAKADEQLLLLVSSDEDRAAVYSLLRVEGLLEKEKYEDAQALIDEIDDSGLSTMLTARYAWSRAVILFRTGDRQEAMEWVESALSADPTQASYHLIKGQIAFESGDMVVAQESLERAIDLDLDGEVSAEAVKILDRI
ncbi:MAG: tetratricopeptide repeat protein [Candidatus Dojkabacteria bacterium]|nr:tetratricopeptide repeat protein [Candidatus Dojkabacteria bacterium]